MCGKAAWPGCPYGATSSLGHHSLPRSPVPAPATCGGSLGWPGELALQCWLLNTDGLSLIPLPLSFIREPDCWLGLGLLPKANVCPLRRSCSQPGQQLGELLVSSHAAWLPSSPRVTPEQVGEHPWACLWGKGWEVSAVLVGSHCPGQQLWHGVNETHSGRGTWKMSALC